MTKLSALVHPQAMLVMSNHFTRLKFDDANVHLPVHVGLFLGKASGSHIEINSAIEILIQDDNGNLKINKEFFENAYTNLFKKTYKDESPIGWYTCGKLNDTLRNDVGPKIEQLVAEYESESLLVGEFDYDPKIDYTDRSPLTLYFNNNSELLPIDYTYEAEPAERIAMIQFQSEGSSENQTQFTAKAFESLDRDLEKVQKYIERVIKKEVPFDHDRVRNAATLAQWWDHNSLEEPGFDKIEEQADLALLCGMLLETLTVYEKKTY